MKYEGYDQQLLQLIDEGLISESIACDVQNIMDETKKDALFVIWSRGLKHAMAGDTILDHYCNFMNRAVS